MFFLPFWVADISLYAYNRLFDAFPIEPFSWFTLLWIKWNIFIAIVHSEMAFAHLAEQQPFFDSEMAPACLPLAEMTPAQNGVAQHSDSWLLQS